MGGREGAAAEGIDRSHAYEAGSGTEEEIPNCHSGLVVVKATMDNDERWNMDEGERERAF